MMKHKFWYGGVACFRWNLLWWNLFFGSIWFHVIFVCLLHRWLDNGDRHCHVHAWQITQDRHLWRRWLGSLHARKCQMHFGLYKMLIFHMGKKHIVIYCHPFSTNGFIVKSHSHLAPTECWKIAACWPFSLLTTWSVRFVLPHWLSLLLSLFWS